MRFNRLEDWLAYQETLNSRVIDLGLDRVNEVLRRMGLDQPWPVIITVAGTNGKGSCVALLGSILIQGGYRVGTYTSPHLLRYNERITIDGKAVDDTALCEAFEQVEQARGDVALTYFEFGTLAAFSILAGAGLDVMVLEVGLGGRLDAVNVLNPDVALITNIAIDHTAWLGEDRESIGREKAGIVRAGRPVVCGDEMPPASVRQAVQQAASPAYFINTDFQYTAEEGRWDWRGARTEYTQLPLPALQGEFQLRNAACVLMVLELLQSRCPVSAAALHRGLKQVSLPGRLQVLPEPVTQIFDVAHNPAAARHLAAALRRMPCKGRTFAVVGMLADKAIPEVLNEMRGVVDEWFVGGLAVPRGADSHKLAEHFTRDDVLTRFDTLTEAYHAAMDVAGPADRVVVFGSFYTVAELMPGIGE
jgi:dihydrofolate synthase/folylpolyglutamate synthase